MSGRYNSWEAPQGKLERMIYTALRTYPNTIAGRPNAGNMALLHIHKGQILPTAIMEAYCRQVLRSFMPELVFTVEASMMLDGTGFQHVTVTYERGI